MKQDVIVYIQLTKRAKNVKQAKDICFQFDWCSAYLDEEITDDLLAEKIWSKANEFNTIMNHTTQLQTLPTENQENKSNIFSQFN